MRRTDVFACPVSNSLPFPNQEELGDMIGVSESYVRAYESGRRNPKPASLQTLADALGVNVEILKILR